MTTILHRALRDFLLAVALAALAACGGLPGRAHYQDLDAGRVAEVSAMLAQAPEGLSPPCSDRAYWSDPRLKAGLGATLRQAGQIKARPYPPWNDALYLEFSRSGSRTAGELMLHARQDLLLPLTIAECLEYQGNFIREIETALRELSGQKSWNLPAVDQNLDSFQGKAYQVDLNAADVATDVAQAIYLLGGKISADTRGLALAALERRVFAPLRETFHSHPPFQPEIKHAWLVSATNWNAVCLRGVTAAALMALASREERAVFVAATEHYAKYYASELAEDGYAVEGPAYWNYGMSHFAEMRERILRASRGKIDLFKDGKIRNFALYGARIQMFPGNVAEFGDSVMGMRPDPDTLDYLNLALGLSLPAAVRDPAQPIQGNTVAMQMLMRLPGPVSAPAPAGGGDPVGIRSYFGNAGVLVSRPAKGSASRLAVTIKAGGNGSHSHNDIGSYAVALGQEQPVGEPGGLRYYDKRTFGSQRYESKVINSYGHPVPVVGGKLQLDAARVRPKVLATQFSDARDDITIDMAPAYALPGLKKLERELRYERSGGGAVEIEDRFAFASPQDFEVALTTHGTWSRIGPDTLEFKSGEETLRSTIKASAEFDLAEERISENNNIYTRIGIRLKQPQAGGAVSVRFYPKP